MIERDAHEQPGHRRQPLDLAHTYLAANMRNQAGRSWCRSEGALQRGTRRSAGGAVCQHSRKEVQELEDADSPVGECIGFNAAMCCLRGRAFEALDNSARAAACFSSALRADPFCYEAYQVTELGDRSR